MIKNETKKFGDEKRSFNGSRNTNKFVFKRKSPHAMYIIVRINV